MSRVWEEAKELSDFDNRLQAVYQFNNSNKYIKRGLALTPTKYCVGFPVRVLEQAGALVHIYTDGTVLLAHGGVELGQGIHTKMIQVASKALQITIEKVRSSNGF
jgi:xanthine dehydrogenase molybdopterin-binding subunit B